VVEYRFEPAVSATEVLASLRGKSLGMTKSGADAHHQVYVYTVELPSGRQVMVWDFSHGEGYVPPCLARVYEASGSWYERTWSTMKYRLGL